MSAQACLGWQPQGGGEGKGGGGLRLEGGKRPLAIRQLVLIIRQLKHHLPCQRTLADRGRLLRRLALGYPPKSKSESQARVTCATHTRARAHTVLGCTAQRFVCVVCARARACVRAAFMPPTHAACRSAACASDSLGPSPRAVRHKAKAANTTIGRPTGRCGTSARAAWQSVLARLGSLVRPCWRRRA